jgi:hypothetical protein
VEVETKKLKKPALELCSNCAVSPAQLNRLSRKITRVNVFITGETAMDLLKNAKE